MVFVAISHLYLKLSQDIMNDLDELIAHLRQAFSSDEIKRMVLDQEWLQRNYDSGIDSTGFCRIACEVIYKLTGGTQKWILKIISRRSWEYGSHYFLEEKGTGNIVDITSDQYTELGITIPYNLGRGTGLRTNSDHLTRKAQILAGRV